MKKISQFKYILTIYLSAFLLSACNYLDVIPPEQPGLDDTMNDGEAVRNFLYSCYTEIEFMTLFDNPSTDEYSSSIMINSIAQQLSYNQLSSSSKGYGRWDKAYNSIGQCNLFLQQLERSNPLGVTEEMKKEYKAEVDFLIAFYHFRVLAEYGPIPIIDHFMPMDTPTSEIPGRSHFDYVVSFICNRLDAAAENLPASRISDQWGRATSTMCYALKGRVLLYAASDLWNGKFPFKNWKNKNYETPGYGKELVSLTYDRSKWEKALKACDFAIEWAESKGGNKLLTVSTMPSRAQNISKPYIPGKDSDNEFKEYVMLMSLLLNSTPNEGNFEYIWGVSNVQASYHPLLSLPLNILERNGSYASGWSLVAPTLYSIEHCYTENGLLPELDEKFSIKGDWLKSANVSAHPDIIKLCVGREPRFYAWFAFDGGEYTQMLKNGGSFMLNMKSSSAQGRSVQSNRNYSVTGFLTKKFTEPDMSFTYTNGNQGNNIDYPLPLIRMGELYLNRAECYAALGMTSEAIDDINIIRRRAGAVELKDENISSKMPLMDWVRNERFIELWGEGHRYFDVRRWMIAPERLKAGVREGLNVMGKYDPTFEEFNVRTRIDQPFMWNDRMYLHPVLASEVYSNPQMVQAPSY